MGGGYPWILEKKASDGQKNWNCTTNIWQFCVKKKTLNNKQAS